MARYAEQIERTARQIEKDVMDPKGVEGLLRIGVSETIAQCWLPDFISRLHQRFPNLEIEINVDISVNLREVYLIARLIWLSSLVRFPNTRWTTSCCRFSIWLGMSQAGPINLKTAPPDISQADNYLCTQYSPVSRAQGRAF
ncbi:MAG: LysR substrate-binding domain-containing protein [Candidatus Competibacteraceae bacterium]